MSHEDTSRDICVYSYYIIIYFLSNEDLFAKVTTNVFIFFYKILTNINIKINSIFPYDITLI